MQQNFRKDDSTPYEYINSRTGYREYPNPPQEPSPFFAILGMIFGILTVILSIIPFLGILAGALAIVFSVSGLKSTRKTLYAAVGLATGIIGLLINLILTVLAFLFLDHLLDLFFRFFPWVHI